jgi:hypothetical protein
MQARAEMDILDAHIRFQDDSSMRTHLNYCCVISDAEPEAAPFARHLFAEPTHKLCFATEHIRKHRFLQQYRQPYLAAPNVCSCVSVAIITESGILYGPPVLAPSSADVGIRL